MIMEKLPWVRTVDDLLTLPPGAVLMNAAGVPWVRTNSRTQPWLSVGGGGYGASTGDLTEITSRFQKHEAPFRLVWMP